MYDPSNVSCDELRAQIEKEIAEIQEWNDSWDENYAMTHDYPTDDASTDVRAIEVLQRPERFNGGHDVARAWLKERASRLGIFRGNGK